MSEFSQTRILDGSLKLKRFLKNIGDIKIIFHGNRSICFSSLSLIDTAVYLIWNEIVSRNGDSVKKFPYEKNNCLVRERKGHFLLSKYFK